MKIAVYAICKNEAQFVDRWMDSMSEADEIVVLDTGSSDNTVELLEARGAAVTVETIFAWPGIGRYIVESINLKDTPCVLGAVVMLAIMLTFINLVVDVIYAFVDPRIKAQYK